MNKASRRGLKTKSTLAKRQTKAKRRHYLLGSIAIAGILLLGTTGYVAYRLTRGPKSLAQAVFDRTSEWGREAEGYRDRLLELLDSAERALEKNEDAELQRLGRDADELGRELSKLRITVSRWTPLEDETLEFLRNHVTHWISYIVEAVENVQVLAEAPPEARRDLILQARRFLVLADSSKAWLNVYWSDSVSISDKRLLSSAPLIADGALSEWRWTPEFADGIDKELLPWDLDGVPAIQMGSQARDSAAGWLEVERAAAYSSEVTASISAACAELEMFSRADTRALDEGLIRRAFEANKSFANQTAAAAAPADSILPYSAAWRGTRGHHEAFMTGIVADSMGDLRIRWSFKAYRLAMLAGTSWNQGLEIAENARLPFGYVPSCQGRLEILFLSPWDVRQDMTSAIPGPRANEQGV